MAIPRPGPASSTGQESGSDQRSGGDSRSTPTRAPSAEQAQTVDRSRENPEPHEVSGAPGPSGPANHPREAPGEGEDLLSQTKRTVGAALQPALRQEAAKPLHELLHQGLDVIFATSFEAALRPQGEETLRLLIRTLLETVDDEETRRDLEAQSEHLVRDMVGATFRSVFTDAVCLHIEGHGDRAIDLLSGGDSAGAIREVNGALDIVLHRVFGAFEDQWQRLIPFLLRVAFAALRNTVESAIKEGLRESPVVGDIVVGLEHERAETESAVEKVEDAAKKARDQVAKVADQIRSRLQEEKQALRDRVREGVISAVGGDRKARRRGPGGKLPSKRSRSDLPSIGRPPSGRPPCVGTRGGWPKSHRR
jgi:hypothetical protein